MDDNAWQSCASPKGYTGLSDGSHTFQVRAVDPSGNADPTPESRQWFVDTTPPDTIITSGPSSGTVTGRQVKFEFTSSESGSTFMCRWSEGVSGSGSWTSCSSPWSIGFLFGGPYTVEVYAIDHVGNADPQPASRTWTVDATAPAAPIINNPADNSFDTDSNVILSGTAEPDSTIEVFDGETSEGTTPPVDSSGAWSMTLTAVGEGDHTYTARATDTANNASASSNSITVNVDTTRPTVSGTRPLNRATNVGRGTNLTATFSEKMTRSTLNNTTFKLYKVNSDGSTTLVSSWSVSSTTDGLKATLDPFGAKTTLLARNTKYKGVVTTGTKDLAGNALVQQRSWTFTTKP